jgi:adenylate cyclase
MAARKTGAALTFRHSVQGQAGDLALWLADAAEKHGDISSLHLAFCDRLADRGLKISRSSLGLEVLHPELTGLQYVWASREVQIVDAERTQQTMIDYRVSPARIVDDTWKPFRRRLDKPSPDLPMLDDLRAGGATDYVIFPLPFLDRNRSAFISFTTQEETGFADQEIDELTVSSLLLGPWLERHVLKRIAVDLLDVYVGRRSGERVYKGAIARGATEVIRAAILMTDLRGFTRFSDSSPLDDVVAMLNRFFEMMVEAIGSEGGEVLKFMGDALLAIFPERDGSLKEPCGAAARAAQGAIAAAGSRAPLLDFGLALHAGDVAYGNIGGRTRLDFTVIGPAVNYTSRMLERTKTTSRVLISETFANTSQLSFIDLGPHTLRDIEGEHRMFTIAEAKGNE